jgi:serine/threonine-protein kinase
MAAMRTLGGRYRLIERLGEGGMSVVWRAYDEALGRPVAVKLLTARYVARASSRDRIRTEAQAAAVLSHPHITGVHDYGESAGEAGEPTPYVVMELLTGPTLAERLRDGPLPVRTALEVCAQVASALAAAHGSGLVHRDVKPGNVMLTPAGAKVLDFGLAAAAGARDEATADGEVWGTPAYLAPERLSSGQVVPASDVYALGLLLYVALTGRQPWPARTVDQLLAAHRHAQPAPLPPIDGLPPAVAELCFRCLAKAPADRPAAHEAARVLAGAVGWRVTSAVAPWSGTLPDQLAAGYSRQLARAGAASHRVRAAAPRSPAPAGIELDPVPTGTTLAHAGPRRRPDRGARWWRAVAVAGSTVAVAVAATAGPWLVGPDPGRLPTVEQGAAGAGAAVVTPRPVPTLTSPDGGGPGPATGTSQPGPRDSSGGPAAAGGAGTGGEMPGGGGPGPGAVGGSGTIAGPDPGGTGLPGTGSTGGPAGPGPTSPLPDPTAAPPPDDGTESSPPPVPPSASPVVGSWETGGGTVTAECTGSEARLLSWEPATGYLVDSVMPGPAPEVTVVFIGPDPVTVVIQCSTGTPVLV